MTAIVLSKIGMHMFNIGFLQIFAGAFVAGGGDQSTLVDLITCFGLLAVYTYIMIEVVNFCYSAIIQIPDKIMRWIGTPQDMMGQQAQAALGAVGSQAAAMSQQVGGSFNQSSGTLGQAGQMRNPSMKDPRKGNENSLVEGFKAPSSGGKAGGSGGGGSDSGGAAK